MTELPKGWSTATIDQVSIKCSQKKPGDEEHLTYIDIGSIDRKIKKITKPQVLLGKDAPSRARRIVNTGDVLVSLTRPNLNAVALVPAQYDEQYASTGFEVIKPVMVDSRYIFALVRSRFFVDAISWVVQGALYPAAKSTDVRNFEFPLPPLNEQIRIADKLDSILAKAEKAQESLEKIPSILKRFRQSVLSAATSGELTKEWREGGDQNWSKVALKEVGTGFNYGSSAKSKTIGEVPVLRMGNLQGGKLDWEKLVYTSNEVEIEKYLVEPGDVLFNRTNSPELVGKTSIYRGERKAIYAGYLIKVKGSDRLNTEYLNIQLNSPHARGYCWQVKTDGVSQSNINAKKLWNGLESLGMELHVSKDYRLPTLTTVKIPPAVDGDGFRNHLLKNFGIEIGNGLGSLSGKVWRIGLMGFNSSNENVDRLLNLFDTNNFDHTVKKLFTEWKLENHEPEFTVLDINIYGDEQNIHYHLYDEMDMLSKSSSMARTTGFTATATINMLLNNLWSKKGVSPPEIVGANEPCINFLFDYLSSRNVKISQI